CDGGRARVIDFMPPPGEPAEHDIIRIVEGIAGTVPIHLDLKVRFAYGRLMPWIVCDTRHATLASGPDARALDCPVPLRPDYPAGRVEADFVVRAGERVPFTLTFYPSHQGHDYVQVDAERELVRTERYWRDWASKCKYEGPYRDAMIRSLITLKALTHAPTG